LADEPEGFDLPKQILDVFSLSGQTTRLVNELLGQIHHEGQDTVPGVPGRYRDIADELRTRIMAGEWEPGSTLPRMSDLAAEYGVNRDTLARAITLLEGEGLVWAVPRRGTIVRHGMTRPRRPRGNIVKRNVATDDPGYSFPSASAQEVWVHHVPRVARMEKLTDPRLARMLGVPVGTEVMHRHRVTGPAGEPPFQTNDSYIHQRGVAAAPDVADTAAAPGDWLYRLEAAGHWPISWRETHRARMPSKEEASLLQIPVTIPVLEIVRVGTSGADDRPIEVTQYVIPSDRVEQIVVLAREEADTEPWPEPPGPDASA
jgi:GntR family transcriptional regulator